MGRWPGTQAPLVQTNPPQQLALVVQGVPPAPHVTTQVQVVGLNAWPVGHWVATQAPLHAVVFGGYVAGAHTPSGPQ